MHIKIFIFLLVFMISNQSFPITCYKPAIGFFNGIRVTSIEASVSLILIKEHLENAIQVFETHKLPISFDLYYNTTKGISNDINEVFRQLLAEENKGNQFPPTHQIRKDYTAHQYIASKLLESNRALLLIAHSQGNYFLNHIYDYCRKTVNDFNRRCTAIHIAPPLNRQNGDYLLSSNDYVISGLYKIIDNQYGDRYTPNINLPFSTKDVLGHNFKTIYMSNTNGSLKRFTELVGSGLLNSCPFL